MANMSRLVMKTAMPVSLMKLLAIPLGCQRTTTKWLVISPGALPQRTPLLNPLDEITSHSTRETQIYSLNPSLRALRQGSPEFIEGLRTSQGVAIQLFDIKRTSGLPRRYLPRFARSLRLWQLKAFSQ